jgi:hypothetical protein
MNPRPLYVTYTKYPPIWGDDLVYPPAKSDNPYMQGGGGEKEERRNKKIKIKNREGACIRNQAFLINTNRIGGVSIRLHSGARLLLSELPPPHTFLPASLTMV